jgi:hypothetical protein
MFHFGVLLPLPLTCRAFCSRRAGQVVLIFCDRSARTADKRYVDQDIFVSQHSRKLPQCIKAKEKSAEVIVVVGNEPLERTEVSQNNEGLNGLSFPIRYGGIASPS